MAIVTKFPRSNAHWEYTPRINPENAYADDGVYATTDRACTTYYFDWDFGIPNDATINSVIVNLKRYVETTSGNNTVYTQTLKHRVEVGTTYADTSEPTSPEIRTKTDNGTWTAAELNDNTLQGLIVSYGDYVSSVPNWHYLDYISVTVDYTTPVVATNGSFAQII